MATEQKHTPGPWSVSATVHAGRLNIFGLNPTAAFHIGTLVSGSKSKLDVLEANARLIAAAPDLLEALGAVIDSKPPSILTEAEAAAWELARAAIAKATQPL